MTSTEKRSSDGYTIERLYAVSLEYRLMNLDDAELNGLEASSSRREIVWNWQFQDERTISVIFGVSSAHVSDVVARARAAYACDFTLPEGKAAVPLDQFVRLNAVATIFPYVREALSNLHSRGPYEVPMLQPTNVSLIPLPSDEAAVKQIRESEQLRAVAERLGYPVDAEQAHPPATAARQRGTTKALPQKVSAKKSSSKKAK